MSIEPTLRKIGVQIILDERDAQTAIDSVPGCVDLHLGEYRRDNVNAARMACWDKMGNDYISFVDPDDKVLPEAFDWCLQTLEANPDATGCYTLERWERPNGQIIFEQQPFKHSLEAAKHSPKHAHHLVVFRRDIYEQFRSTLSKTKYGIEWGLVIAATASGNFIQIPKIGYVWTQNPQGAHLQARDEHLQTRTNILQQLNLQ